MAFISFVCQFVVLLSSLLDNSSAAPVIKNSPQILSSKLDRDGPSNWEWQQQRQLLSSLIDTGDLTHPVSSSVSLTPPFSSNNSEKTRASFDKTRDSLKVPNSQPKRREETTPPRGFSPELFQFLRQYGRLTRIGEEPLSSEAGLHFVFPPRRGKQFEKGDAVQKISSARKEDEGNVQKIYRKEETESGEETITVEEIVDEKVEENFLMDADEEDARGNTTEIEIGADENQNKTFMEKLRDTNYFAIIYLGGFVILVLFFCFLACSEIFCERAMFGSTSHIFVPQAYVTRSYCTPPKSTTPPPPYHLFAPPQYMDIVKETERRKTVQCACIPQTPSPPYRRERTQARSPEDRTDSVSILHKEDTGTSFQVTPVPTYINIDSKAVDKTKKKTFGNREGNKAEPCSKQQSEGRSSTQPFDSDNAFRQSISFVEYSTGQEHLYAFKKSNSFNDCYLEGHEVISSDKKPLENTNQLFEDNIQFEQHLTSMEKVNETDRTALSEFMKDNDQFRNQLKTKIRNSLSFSSSQSSNCSDQLENQYKHSTSCTEQIGKAMDNHMSVSNLKQQQHSSCFAIGSLHHSIPELIKLNDDTDTNDFVENSHPNPRTDRDCHRQSMSLNKHSLAQNLLDNLDISCTRLNNPFPSEEDYNKASPNHTTDLELNNDTDRDTTMCDLTTICDQSTNTCSTLGNPSPQESTDKVQSENFKAKIFFIDDLDDDW